MDLEKLVEKAVNSSLFTSPVLGADLERFLKDKSNKIKNLANQALKDGVEHIYWVGAGNSMVNLLSGKELMDRFTNIPSDCYFSYEFVWRNPKRLNKKSWVFLASFSGATEDTVVALRHAKIAGAKTIVLVNKADSLMGLEADEIIDYNSKCLYVLPLAAAFIFALEIARLEGRRNDVEEILKDLYKLPELLKKQYVEEKQKAKKLAEKFADQNLIYTLGSGPCYGLAYKFGLTVFMENMRVNGSFIEATEFRHGPVEMLDKNKPAFVILMGTDESRTVVARVAKLIKEQVSHLIVFDMAEYPKIHSLLAPFALMIPLQWFAVYSALMRGITDLDDRAFMGKSLLGKGVGVTWP
ncbi:MAG: SIS domain-containing protein [Candidatus Humimicrobiaceae bacterium]